MYGNSVGPPSRSAATVITLRVLFAVAGLLTCGVLACVPLFRVAVLRGRWSDWSLAWASLVVSVAGFYVVGTLPESDYRTDLALGILLLTGAAATAYFLVVDIRAHAAPRPYPGYAPPPRTSPIPPAGPGPYYNHHPAPHQTHPPHPIHLTHPIHQTHHQQPIPQPPVPQTPFTPPPARIDQVRAELDELSDYLRKHDSNGNGNGNSAGSGDHEGGR